MARPNKNSAEVRSLILLEQAAGRTGYPLPPSNLIHQARST